MAERSPERARWLPCGRPRSRLRPGPCSPPPRPVSQEAQALPSQDVREAPGLGTWWHTLWGSGA